jgi:hypothetical protein
MSELPIELRGVSANLVDRVEPNALAPVGPSMLSSTPGLAGAAVTGAPFAPGPSIEDPQALQLGLARVAGEHFGMPTLPTTIVPTTIAPSTSPQTFGGAPTFAPSIPDSPSGFDLDAIALAMLPPQGIAPNHGPISTAAVPRSGASNEASGYSNAPPPATPPTNVLDRGLAHATPGISPELVTPEAPGFSPTLVPMVDNTAPPFGSAASPGQARLVDNTALPFGSAASPGQARLVDNTAREAEVANLDAAVGAEQHVVGFEVAMDEAGGMGSGESASCGEKRLDDLVRGVLDLEPLAQRGAGDVLHRDVDRVVNRAELVDHGDVWMRQPCECFRFAAQALREIAVAAAELRTDQLQRDGAIETRIFGRVDHAHRAGAAQAFDDVRTNLGACGKRAYGFGARGNGAECELGRTGLERALLERDTDERDAVRAHVEVCAHAGRLEVG